MVDYVISGLVKRRAELAGEIEELQARLRQATIDLDHLDATILLFDPDHKLDDIKAKYTPPRDGAYKGEVARILFDTLRQSQAPLSTRMLALHVMAARGQNTTDETLVKRMQARVGSVLRWHRKKGAIRSESGQNRVLSWSLNQ